MGKEENEVTKGIASSVFLVAAVAVVMVAGMLLKTDALHAPSSPAVAPASASALPLGSTVAQELPPPEPAEAKASEPPAADTAVAPVPAEETAQANNPLLTRLASRAEDDSARLAKSRGRWTAQLLVACKPETVERLLGNAGGANGLYVLPAQVKDEPCFRVCFGTYASSQEAALASDLPKALRGKERIGAVEIAKVLP